MSNSLKDSKIKLFNNKMTKSNFREKVKKAGKKKTENQEDQV